MSEYIDNKTYNESLPSGSQRFALISLTSLFFIWGFITCLNDILIPHLKAVFELNYTQAMLIQFCFFGAYFLVSVPAGALVKRIGFKGGIISGLLIAGLGCILFYPAASVREYWLFLAALFVLAAGITILQVSANPYVTVLGKPETAASRLTLTQAFNSLGTTIAPQFGALIILGGVVTLGVQELAALTPVQLDNYYAEEAASVQVPYLGLAAALFILAALFAFLKLPTVAFEQQDNTQQADKSAWSHRQLVLGVIAIFVYVGGEVAIGSFIVNFLGEANIAGMAEAEAASYLTYYWMGAMLGRFIGAAVMMKVNAGKVLAFNALAASLLVATAILSSGSVAMWALLAVGLFNSIMFPTIFSLALNGLGSATSQASGALCLGIVGGAIVPLFQGMLADAIGIQLAFVLPIACYLYIAFYGLKGSVVKPQD